MSEHSLILAIESSCDETAASVVEDGRHVLSNIVASQIDLHTLFGGVVPEIASRKHIEMILPVIREAMSRSGKTFDDLDAIAVTLGPGLVGPLLVGVSVAKSLAYALKKPLIGVHHIEGHIAGNYLGSEIPTLPFVCLVVSGGHTLILYIDNEGKEHLLARTRDDAAGEAFDKVARVIGLGYPGGPKIDAAAKRGNPEAYTIPVPKLSGNPLDFSFSGIKTAVLNLHHHAEQTGEKLSRDDLAASFQRTVVRILTEHTMKAVEKTGVSCLAIAGGVAANQELRSTLRKEAEKRGIQFVEPALRYCTDNAAMIGAAAHRLWLRGETASLDMNAYPNLPFEAYKGLEEEHEE